MAEPRGSYLIRCHRLVSQDYPEIARMEPTEAADYLLHLRRTGRIEMTLFHKSPTSIACKIVDLKRGLDAYLPLTGIPQAPAP